jgi:hypothetical protein
VSPTDAQVRRSALAVAAVLALIAAVRLWQKHAPWLLAAIALALAAGALVAPAALRGPYRAWMALARALGWIVSRAVLLVAFALVLTPVALVARLLGKRFLDLKPDKSAPSYWVPRDGAPPRYEKMY